MKQQLLADRIAQHLSYEARETLCQAGVWIDQTKAATTEQFLAMLLARRIEPTDAMIDVEQHLGGATTRFGTVYGVHNSLLAEEDRRSTPIFLVTTGGTPRLYVSGELQNIRSRRQVMVSQG